MTFDVDDLSDKQWFQQICRTVGDLENNLIGIEDKLDRIIQILEVVHKDKLN